MLAQTEQHVADGGLIYCGWRREQVAVGECEACPAFRELRVDAPTSAHPVETVRCTELIPLA